MKASVKVNTCPILLFIFIFLLTGCTQCETYDSKTELCNNEISNSIPLVAENHICNNSSDAITLDENSSNSESDAIDCIISHMSLEEKVAQLFIVTPEDISNNADSTSISDETKNGIINYPVAGFIYFSNNLVDPQQTKTLLDETKSIYKEYGFIKPFLSVDEEGGLVARIGNNHAFNVVSISPMSTLDDTLDAVHVGETIGDYLAELGFNLDFAPVADVLSNPSNTVIGNRSFGSDPKYVWNMANAEAQALRSKGIIPVIKHFPGHGATETDSHEGYACNNKTLDELLQCDLFPFKAAAENQVEMIMAGHITLPNVTDDQLPASLSYELLTKLLRKQFGYEGVIISDAMGMCAITDSYSSSEAAVMAINAGIDIILLPEDFHSAYRGILDALDNNVIKESQINEAVYRIISLKQKMLYQEID